MLSRLIPQHKVDRMASLLDRAEHVVLVGHTSPDGDALGATLAMWHFLKSKGKDATVVMPNAFPDTLSWLPGAKDVVLHSADAGRAEAVMAAADVICCLDFNAPKRVGALGDALVASGAVKLMVDHHPDPEGVCGLVISHPELSSTSELVFRLICAMGCWYDLSYESAVCICTGMMTDTGGFTYNANNPETYYIVGKLLEKGIDKDDIYRRVFNTQTEVRMRLVGHMLTDCMAVLQDYASAVIILTKDDFAKYPIRKGETEGFVNMPLSIKGIIFSAFMREDKDMIKVSLRSVGDFPCNEVAQKYFGGGGHKNASGGEYYGSMDEARDLLKKALFEFQDRLLQARRENEEAAK